MNSITNERIGKAARRYLEAKGYTVLDEFELDGTLYIVSDDFEEISIARVAYGLDCLPAQWCDLESFEQVAAHYLKDHDVVDVPVRCDSIDFHVIGKDRAFLRHTIGCKLADCAA